MHFHKEHLFSWRHRWFSTCLELSAWWVLAFSNLKQSCMSEILFFYLLQEFFRSCSPLQIWGKLNNFKRMAMDFLSRIHSFCNYYRLRENPIIYFLVLWQWCLNRACHLYFVAISACRYILRQCWNDRTLILKSYFLLLNLLKLIIT